MKSKIVVCRRRTYGKDIDPPTNRMMISKEMKLELHPKKIFIWRETIFYLDEENTMILMLPPRKNTCKKINLQ
jgi:hypothetical protein